jgi:hypothetical protein
VSLILSPILGCTFSCKVLFKLLTLYTHIAGKPEVFTWMAFRPCFLDKQQGADAGIQEKTKVMGLNLTYIIETTRGRPMGMLIPECYQY